MCIRRWGEWFGELGPVQSAPATRPTSPRRFADAFVQQQQRVGGTAVGGGGGEPLERFYAEARPGTAVSDRGARPAPIGTPAGGNAWHSAPFGRPRHQVTCIVLLFLSID